MAEIRRISLVLSGGISLGAYHAGALSEIGFAFAKWNEARANVADDDARAKIPIFYVDVIAGASAGCMTGTMFADFWSMRRDKPEEFVLNCLETWCDDGLLVTNLLDPKKTDSNSLMSTEVIDGIAGSALGKGGKISLPEGQEALILRCMVTDVEGREANVYMPSASGKGVYLKPRTYGSSVSFLYQNSGVREMEMPRPVDGAPMIKAGMRPADVRQRIKWAAMASGAFPFAWTPISLVRQWKDMPPPLGPTDDESQKEVFENWFPKTYTDGGVSNNMPLSLAATAMSMYAAMGGTTFETATAKRTYILLEVMPDATDETVEGGLNETVTPPFRDLDYPMARMGMPVFSAAREQTFYLDLQQAAKVNELLDDFDYTFVPVFARIAGSVSNPGVLRKEIQTELEDRLGAGYVKNEWRRVESAAFWTYATHESMIDLSSDQIDLAVTLIASALYSGDLHLKHDMDVFQVKPKRVLSGAFMGAFGGFMNSRFRREDFRSGIEDAAQQLIDLYEGLGLANFGLRQFETAMQMQEIQSLETPEMEGSGSSMKPRTRTFDDVDENVKVEIGDMLATRLVDHFWKVRPLFRWIARPLIRSVIRRVAKI